MKSRKRTHNKKISSPGVLIKVIGKTILEGAKKLRLIDGKRTRNKSTKYKY